MLHSKLSTWYTPPLINFLQQTQNQIYSSVLLGIAYYRGYIMEKNYSLSCELFNRHLNVCSLSMNGLANMYYYGYGVKKDYPRAIGLYELAIHHGNPCAMHNLAQIYEDGIGVEQNYPKAIELYEMAIKYNDPDSMYNVARIYAHVTKDEKNYPRAIKLFGILIERNCSNAMNGLALMYEKGIYVEKNYPKAIELFEMSIQCKNPYAMANLGQMYMYGIGVQRDLQKAELLFKTSLELGKKDTIKYLVALYKQYMDEFNHHEIVVYLLDHGPSQLEEIFGYDMSTINILQTIYQENSQLKKQLDETNGMVHKQASKIVELTTHINLVPGGPEYLKLLEEWNKKIDKLT